MNRKALIVLTSHTELGPTGKKTGFNFEEIAASYWAFRDAKYEVVLSSIAGEDALPAPESLADDTQERPQSVKRFLADEIASSLLKKTLQIGDASPEYGVVFLAGGHGAMWDFPNCAPLASLVSRSYANGSFIGAVGYGVSGLLKARKPDGAPLVSNLRVTGSTDTQEEVVGSSAATPFPLEKRILSLGGLFESGPQREPYAVRDGRLITGQNQQSSSKVVELALEAIAEKKTAVA